ncbi:hypothetical protein VNO80_28762 [Phaseolus coccineus]|uniref:DUF4283 domain-containing protein n=1 Tax=Phaseolus coccineus TaxID=3886 RepID=A0AAN9QED8_PHACN
MFGSILPWNVSLAVNERYAWVQSRGIPLELWSRQCFECIGALVGKMVEVDQATFAKEVLEYARFRVCVLAGGLVKVTKEVSINRIPCLVSLEEEAGFPEYTLRSFFSKWGACSVPVSDVSSKEGDGREFLDSVGSDSNDGNGVREGEEASVQGQVVQEEHSLGAVHLQWDINSALNSFKVNGEVNEVGGVNVVHGVINNYSTLESHLGEEREQVVSHNNEELSGINEVHAYYLTNSINEVHPSINEVHAPCLTSPINEVHAHCLTNHINDVLLDINEVHAHASPALLMSPVGNAGGVGIMSSVSGAGCVSPVGDDGRVSPTEVVGCVSQGAVVLVGSPAVMLTQGLEKELSGFSPNFGVPLMEEVAPTTLEEVAGAGLKGEVPVTEGKGRVVSARLNSGSKENDCACSNARSMKVKELASILVTDVVSRSC